VSIELFDRLNLMVANFVWKIMVANRNSGVVFAADWEFLPPGGAFFSSHQM
jgi:hypothetical protein